MTALRIRMRKFGAWLRRWVPGFALCLAIVTLYLMGGLNFAERQLAAARFQWLKSDPSDSLVVVAIDAHSLQQMPFWPWPRSWHAEIIDRLQTAGASSIIFDVDFSAASSLDESSVEDDALAAALARAGNLVTLPVFQQRESAGTTDMKTSEPLPDFARHVRIASANVRGDSDGIVRSMSRYERWDTAYVPTIANVAANQGASERGRFIIDFGIRAERIPVVSFVDVIDGRVDPKLFAGKTVMIGSTALELGDNIATAMGGITPGIMIQAIAAESLILDRALAQISPKIVAALACLLFLLVQVTSLHRGRLRGFLVGLCAFAGVSALSLAIQRYLPLQLDTAPLLIAIGAAMLASLLSRLRDLDLRLLGQAILLRRTEVLMREVVASSTDGVLVIDEHGKVRRANPAAERMLGQSSADIVGAHFFDLMATASHQPPIHSLSRMAYADCPVQIELTRPDGSTLIADVSVNRIPDHPSATFVAQLHDVSDMKRREAELRLARDEAEAASNSKSQFLANMSHELRTPLNAVIGFSEIMKAELLGPIGTESYRGYSSSIHDSARHLLSIINDILDISSIESGTPKLYEDVHEPAQLCQSVVALVQGRADTAQIGLKIMVDPQTDLLYADGRMVKQMMINLVGNAIKFSPKGARIEIKVAPTGDDQGGMVFSVVDHGIGIAKADIPRILKPFEQVETAFARNFDGIGLGLPLVNSMARLHGAIFTIDSELNKGTVASILFPPARVKPRPAEPATAQPATHVHVANVATSSATPKRRIAAAE
jgi:PAS domain S-box-containing protein